MLPVPARLLATLAAHALERREPEAEGRDAIGSHRMLFGDSFFWSWHSAPLIAGVERLLHAQRDLSAKASRCSIPFQHSPGARRASCAALYLARIDLQSRRHALALASGLLIATVGRAGPPACVSGSTISRRLRGGSFLALVSSGPIASGQLAIQASLGYLARLEGPLIEVINSRRYESMVRQEPEWNRHPAPQAELHRARLCGGGTRCLTVPGGRFSIVRDALRGRAFAMSQ